MQLPVRIFLPLLWSVLIPLTPAAHEGDPHVEIEEIELGEGDVAQPFSTVEVNYIGKFEDGEVFASSVAHGKYLRFVIGQGQVIAGWEMGIQGMKVGGKRELTIPPELAYGKRGKGEVIPPNATLIFEIELLSVRPPPFETIDNAELDARLEQGVKLIDIRTRDEWRETGVIAGSIEMTAFDEKQRFLVSFTEKLQQAVERDEAFMLIDRDGNRSAMLANYLATRGGFPNAVNVRGGIAQWIDEGRPVSKDGS